MSRINDMQQDFVSTYIDTLEESEQFKDEMYCALEDLITEAQDTGFEDGVEEGLTRAKEASEKASEE